MSETQEHRDGTPADEAEVRTLHRRMLEEWNARSARGIAALYAADGTVVGFDGSEYDGPAEIESSIGRVFADHRTATYVGIVRSVRFASADVAILRAVVGMVPPGGDDINPATNAIQSLVAARKEGGWRIAHFQNTPAAWHGRPEAVEELTAELRRAKEEREMGGGVSVT